MKIFSKLTLTLLICAVASIGHAQVKKPSPTPVAKGRAPSGNGNVDSTKALEVRGQSRNLSMMLVLKNKKNSIDFVKPRENYAEEFKNQGF